MLVEFDGRRTLCVQDGTRSFATERNTVPLELAVGQRLRLKLHYRGGSGLVWEITPPYRPCSNRRATSAATRPPIPTTSRAAAAASGSSSPPPLRAKAS